MEFFWPKKEEKRFFTGLTARSWLNPYDRSRILSKIVHVKLEVIMKEKCCTCCDSKKLAEILRKLADVIEKES